MSSRMKYEEGLKRVEKEVFYGLMQPVVSEQLLNIVSGGLWLADRRIKSGRHCNSNSF